MSVFVVGCGYIGSSASGMTCFISSRSLISRGTFLWPAALLPPASAMTLWRSKSSRPKI